MKGYMGPARGSREWIRMLMWYVTRIKVRPYDIGGSLLNPRFD